MKRGEIWWASLTDPLDSGPGYRRPVLVIQSNAFNESNIKTVIVAVVTSNLRLATAPGNVRLPKRKSKLKKDSVVNVSQIITIDKSCLTERMATLPQNLLLEIEVGLRLVVGL